MSPALISTTLCLVQASGARLTRPHSAHSLDRTWMTADAKPGQCHTSPMSRACLTQSCGWWRTPAEVCQRSKKQNNTAWGVLTGCEERRLYEADPAVNNLSRKTKHGVSIMWASATCPYALTDINDETTGEQRDHLHNRGSLCPLQGDIDFLSTRNKLH